MDIMTLLLGLGVPMMAGIIWIRWIFGSFANLNRSLIIGYGMLAGFFLVYACLILARNAGIDLAFWQVIFIIVLITILPAGLLYKFNNLSIPDKTGARFGLVSWLLMSAVILHLAIYAGEVILRPVYPWDAWTTWAFRAKAMFYSGIDTVFLPDSLWKGGRNTYVVPAFDYPMYLTLLQYWMAISFGQWHESLINLPSLLLGTAVGFGLYGQAIRLGLSENTGLLLVFFIVSMPAMGAHLSLSGYADIWVAAYFGLGTILLYTGFVEANKLEMMVGLAFIAATVLIKNEGLIWFAVSIALYVLMLLPSRLAFWGTALSSVGLIALLLNTQGPVNIPLLGTYEFKIVNNISALKSNMFMIGNWNLLWPGLLFTLTFLRLAKGSMLYRFISHYVYLFLLSLAVIFFMSTEAEWASQYTAINRIILHFSIGMVFLLVVLMSKSSQDDC